MSLHDALTDEQKLALQEVEYWIKTKPSQVFVLRGYAGTGKTFLTQALAERFKGRIVFTAPTNKAVRVLRTTITTKEYRPECRTIYSLLGLRLEPSGEVRELAKPEEEIDLGAYRLVVLDEGSMVNGMLKMYLEQAANSFGFLVLILGDPAQLPPVKELRSPVWDYPHGAQLTTVMRHDNQILTLATAVRKVVDHPAPTILLRSDNSGDQGVWKLSPRELEATIIASADRFRKATDSKVIAWRNITVDAFNKLIRKELFGPLAAVPWNIEDRVIFTAPAKTLDDEPMASTDDEGEVTMVSEGWHPFHGEFKIFNVTIMLDDNRLVVARVLHPESEMAFARKVEQMAQTAREDKRKWKAFWEFKEVFHGLRHAYAITAHRAQGSTYERVFVDYKDILLNQNRQEAYRCLYVAFSRAKRELYMG